jgi:hypothetical protein
VNEAVTQLIQLSRDGRFELAAAYADAVQRHGGTLTEAAALLELARYESERPMAAAMNDPARLSSRMAAGRVHQSNRMGSPLGALLRGAARHGGDAGRGWRALGRARLWRILRRARRAGVVRQQARAGLPEMPRTDIVPAGEGAVPRLARELAREAVVLAARTMSA